MSPPYLILGIGNCLLTDDGVGIHAVRCLQEDPPPQTQVAETGTDFMSAIPLLEACTRALVIDAMEAGGAPGSLYRCRTTDLAAEGQKFSLHELGLLSVLEFIEEKRRPEVHLLGVEPARIAYGLELSAELSVVLPRVVAAARQIVADFSR